MPASKFTKKPVTVDAWQVPTYDPDGDITGYLDEGIAIAKWCGGRSYLMTVDTEKAWSDAIVNGPHIVIDTLEGQMAALPGDYVIRGVAGEFYPCKPAIFAETYEAAAEEGGA